MVYICNHFPFSTFFECHTHQNVGVYISPQTSDAAQRCTPCGGSEVRTSYWVQSQSTSEEGLRAAESQVGVELQGQGLADLAVIWGAQHSSFRDIWDEMRLWNEL